MRALPARSVGGMLGALRLPAAIIGDVGFTWKLPEAGLENCGSTERLPVPAGHPLGATWPRLKISLLLKVTEKGRTPKSGHQRAFQRGVLDGGIVTVFMKMLFSI